MTGGPHLKMGGPIEIGPPLECGCRRGHVLCDEAQSLWAAVGVAYDRRDYDGYDRALNAYNEHFGVQP